MSKVIQCDNCNRTIEEDNDKFGKWYSNSEYGFDACSKECYQELVNKNYSEENE